MHEYNLLFSMQNYSHFPNYPKTSTDYHSFTLNLMIILNIAKNHTFMVFRITVEFSTFALKESKHNEFYFYFS